MSRHAAERRPRTRVRLKLAAALTATTFLATGCGFSGIYSLPLPGGEGVSGPKFTVTVHLRDALDLVPYSSVKVNGASVGRVLTVRLEDGHAVVECEIQEHVKLPANAIARLEQTSLLGEKFVEIEPPKVEAPRGRLLDGGVIPLIRTDTSATVEDVLGSLALLLNGGGLHQVRTIAREVNDALDGREGAVKDTLRQLQRFIASLDDQKAHIIDAMEGIDDLAATIRAQERILTRAVEEMPQALNVLANSENQLLEMLESLDRFGNVAVRVIRDAGDDLVTNLRNLEPTLRQLAKVGQLIPNALSLALTYPVADGVEKAFYGDYSNIHITLDLDKDSLIRNFTEEGPQ